MKSILCSLLLLFTFFYLYALPPTVSEHIHLDQFGYRPSAQKTCIISVLEQEFVVEQGAVFEVNIQGCVTGAKGMELRARLY